MDSYLLQKEEELQKLTDYLFVKSDKIYSHWYSVVDEEIFEHSRLLNTMEHYPEYIIYERYDNSHNPILVTIYYNRFFNVIHFIPFGSWKLYENTSSFGKKKFFIVEDPTGVKRRVGLTEYFPYVPGYLRNYTQYGSFDEFDRNQDPDTPNILSFIPKK